MNVLWGKTIEVEDKFVLKRYKSMHLKDVLKIGRNWLCPEENDNIFQMGMKV